MLCFCIIGVRIFIVIFSLNKDNEVWFDEVGDLDFYVKLFGFGFNYVNGLYVFVWWFYVLWDGVLDIVFGIVLFFWII